MAKLYHISFFSVSGIAYDVEIHDEDHTGSSEEINGRRPGFQVDWQGGSADFFAPIISSSCSFNMLIEAEISSLETFITNLISADEERFTLHIYKESLFYWGGYIITDQVSFEDKFYPFNLQLFAVDGLARLKDFDYKNRETGADYEGRLLVIDHIFNLINIGRLPVKLGFPTSHLLFSHNIDWFEENMNTSTDPFAQITIDSSIFVEIDTEGNKSYITAYDLLAMICEKFGARLFWLDGRFWLMQIGAYAAVNQEIYSYAVTGIFQSKITSGYLTDLDYINRNKQAGIIYNFLPPHKKICVDYVHNSDPNRAAGLVWDETTLDYVTLPGVIVNTAPFDTTVKVLARITVKTTQPVGPNMDLFPFLWHRYEVRISIRWGDLVFHKPTFGPIYALEEIDDGIWQPQGTATVFGGSLIHAYSPFIHLNNNGTELVYEVQLTTEALPQATTEGNLEVKIVLERVWGQADADLLLTEDPDFYEWKVDDLSIILENQDLGINPDEKTRRICVESESVGNTIEKTMVTTIGDGPFGTSPGRLALEDGTPTVNWRRGTTGDFLGIEQLLGTEFLNVHAKPVRVLQGNIIGQPIDMRTALLDTSNGITYTALRLSHSAFDERYSVEMGQVNFYDLTLIYPPPIIQVTNPGATTVGGVQVSNAIRNTTATSTPHHNSQTLQPGTIATILGSTFTSVRNEPSAVNANNLLNIDPLNYTFLRAGDKFKILHFATNQYEELTVGADYVPGADTISIVEDLQHTHLEDSIISVSYSGIAQSSQPLTQKAENFSGEYWDIIAAALPAPGMVSENEIDRKVKVWRSTGKVIYNFSNGFEIDVTGGNNRIRFKPKCRGENVFIEIN
jgi:hypothetical protein